MLPSVGIGLTVKARERKEGLECTRNARLGPSGVGTHPGGALWVKVQYHQKGQTCYHQLGVDLQ